VIIASRVREVSFPEKTKEIKTVRDFIGVYNGFPKIPAGHKSMTGFLHTSAHLSPKNLKRIESTPIDGGTRSSWKDNDDLQLNTYQGKDKDFKDVYGRMFWDKPAPTITTRFNSLSNGRFGHPEENRAISLREGAVLQTFPKSYIFRGRSEAVIAKHIGNAVPPELAKRIGLHILKISSKELSLYQ
jgi:DNA (cytosine-5)-methyltransferase 1